MSVKNLVCFFFCFFNLSFYSLNALENKGFVLIKYNLSIFILSCQISACSALNTLRYARVCPVSFPNGLHRKLCISVCVYFDLIFETQYMNRRNLGLVNLTNLKTIEIEKTVCDSQYPMARQLVTHTMRNCPKSHWGDVSFPWEGTH